MTQMRKIVRAQINPLGDREVEVVMSTDALARDGHILLPGGCQLRNYLANPIVLWSHDPDKPIGNAEDLAVGVDQIVARAVFAPAGLSHKADEICGLTKAGVIRAVSIGFDPIDMEPLDPKKPRGGQRISSWELLEMSFVSVPADVGALVTARAHGEEPMPEPKEAATPRRRKARATAVRGKLVLKRGLYQLANLCYLFEELGWQVDSAKWEATLEADASEVPAMLADVLHGLGEALLAMAQEEIAEALAGHDVELDGAEDDPADEILVVEERAHIAAAKTPAARAFRRGLAHAKLRAGKTLSAETVRCLRDAKAAHEDAMDLHRGAIKKHKEGMAAVDDMMDRAGVSDDDLGEQASDDDSTEIQTSDGTADSEGSSNDRHARPPVQRATAGAPTEALSPDFRRRQADALALAAV
jgi:HK97 family phage prohead protease